MGDGDSDDATPTGGAERAGTVAAGTPAGAADPATQGSGATAGTDATPGSAASPAASATDDTPGTDDATATNGGANATATDGTSAPTATNTTTGAGAGATATATTGSGSGGANPTATSGRDTVTGGSAEEAALITEIKKRTAELRELAFLQDVPVNVISREELAANLLEMIESDYSPEEAADDALELWLLRLVPERDIDLYQFQLDLLSEQVAGYYDPAVDALFVVDDSGGINGSTILTLSHELTHALQDQHYDLEAMQPDDLDADASTAVLALIEGDAESMTYSYIEELTPEQLAQVFADAMAVDTTVLDAAPAYLSTSLYFPYERGIEFVNSLFLAGGEEAVDAAFNDPPQSTEQILHPEKYLAAQRDNPVIVDLPDAQSALGSGWELVVEDTLGEFDLQVLLRENGAGNAEAAAAGWGGSSYAIYQSGSGANAQAVSVMGSVWDTAADATEFRTALRTTLNPGIDSGTWTDDAGRHHRLLEVDGVLYLITGTDRAAVEAVSTSLGS